MKRFAVIVSILAACLGADAQYYYRDAKNPEMLHHASYHGPSRRVMVLPEVNGYKVYKADLHTHTVFSDGKVMPDFRMEEAWNDGLDIVAVTEHIEVRSCERTFVPYLAAYTDKRFKGKAKNTSLVDRGPDAEGIMVDLNFAYDLAAGHGEKYGLTVIRGTEITRNGSSVGHFNALFTTDNNTIYDPDPVQAIRNAKAQGALVMHNHPGWHRKNLEMTQTERSAYDEGLIDGVEVMNTAEFYPGIIDRVREKNLFIAANTDIHNSTAGEYRMSGFERPMTLVLAHDKSPASVRKALEERRTIAYAFNTLCGEENLLKDFFEASVSVEVLSRTEKEKVVMLTNNTSVQYLIQRKGQNPVHLDPHSAIKMGIGAKNKSLEISVLNMWCGAESHPKIALPLDKEEYDVYLLIGQSNMAGRAEVLPEDGEIIEGVYLLNDRNQVEPARGRLNRYAFEKMRVLSGDIFFKDDCAADRKKGASCGECPRSD